MSPSMGNSLGAPIYPVEGADLKQGQGHRWLCNTDTTIPQQLIAIYESKLLRNRFAMYLECLQTQSD